MLVNFEHYFEKEVDYLMDYLIISYIKVWKNCFEIENIVNFLSINNLN